MLSPAWALPQDPLPVKCPQNEESVTYKTPDTNIQQKKILSSPLPAENKSSRAKTLPSSSCLRNISDLYSGSSMSSRNSRSWVTVTRSSAGFSTACKSASNEILNEKIRSICPTYLGNSKVKKCYNLKQLPSYPTAYSCSVMRFTGLAPDTDHSISFGIQTNLNLTAKKDRKIHPLMASINPKLVATSGSHIKLGYSDRKLRGLSFACSEPFFQRPESCLTSHSNFPFRPPKGLRRKSRALSNKENDFEAFLESLEICQNSDRS
ncbi:hypothetical protein NADFUDRAFT_49019 [Nadsonia fulvescens var. elongata DSM 6958]|uniref:Uncharacterized protein n=1 Tax=Nadsonia fulvescens var. elongata DSM 6958 TaxID=857566 RepID=A0A1E3PSY5_9ASCO|nr:hypothetical protein NADFUDRAFT_49019 [Nadsonia fulvescens var. elongata DSM 6958]